MDTRKNEIRMNNRRNGIKRDSRNVINIIITLIYMSCIYKNMFVNL